MFRNSENIILRCILKKKVKEKVKIFKVMFFILIYSAKIYSILKLFFISVLHINKLST